MSDVASDVVVSGSGGSLAAGKRLMHLNFAGRDVVEIVSRRARWWGARKACRRSLKTGYLSRLPIPRSSDRGLIEARCSHICPAASRADSAVVRPRPH